MDKASWGQLQQFTSIFFNAIDPSILQHKYQIHVWTWGRTDRFYSFTICQWNQQECESNASPQIYTFIVPSTWCLGLKCYVSLKHQSRHSPAANTTEYKCFNAAWERLVILSQTQILYPLTFCLFLLAVSDRIHLTITRKRERVNSQTPDTKKYSTQKTKSRVRKSKVQGVNYPSIPPQNKSESVSSHCWCRHMWTIIGTPVWVSYMVMFLRWESVRKKEKEIFSESKREKSLFEGDGGVLRKKGRRD